VRKSWLEKLGESYPKTWADALRLARKFQDQDPDGNGRADTFGFALQGGNASVMVQMLEWACFGAGLRHVAIDAEGNVVFDQPRNVQVITEHLKLYSEYKLVSPETRNHIFTDMYQLIEGGRAGMFRVGDFNVKKWDTEALKGDYVIGPLPSFFPDVPPSVVVHGLRSPSVPANGKNVAAAAKFAQFMTSKGAQEVSLRWMGSAVRSDLSIEGLTPGGAWFAKVAYPAQPNDFLDSVHPWYPQFKEALYKELTPVMATPPADWNKWAAEVATRLRAVVAELKKKS
jgi:ABC-type glycerol-3-phosphate transport system substrate-binding protein